MALTPVSEALRELLGQMPPTPSVERLSLQDCGFRVLASSLIAGVDVPPFDNSAMDGYAVRAEDLPGPLPVSQRIPAGAPTEPLAPGTAARIFTGGALPEGADSVVMQEDATVEGGAVTFSENASVGSHIRRRGDDICLGSEVLPAGTVLTPQALGLAASLGQPDLPVFRRLRVAVLATGDELVEPGQQPAAWQIFNSNATQIAALLRALGFHSIVGHALPDDPEVIGDALEAAARDADCVITCGGVSVGEEDHVRSQIEARGSLALWKLAIKPGKPLAFGHVNDCPLFGLPGNPVSAWATFVLIVKPWLMRAQGANVPAPRRIFVRAAFTVDRPGSREEYLRVELHGEGMTSTARLAGSQSSGVLSSVCRADGLAVVPAGETLAEGDMIQVLLISELLSPLTA